MKSVIYKFAYPFFKIYWFIFRPKTQGVQCLILTADQLLLIRHTYGYSAWTLSGGGIKKRETKEEAVKREVKEELGLDITPEYIGEFTHNTEYKIDTVYCFFVRIDKVEPKIDHGEIKEAKWWNINNLPNNFLEKAQVNLFRIWYLCWNLTQRRNNALLENIRQPLSKREHSFFDGNSRVASRIACNGPAFFFVNSF